MRRIAGVGNRDRGYANAPRRHRTAGQCVSLAGGDASRGSGPRPGAAIPRIERTHWEIVSPAGAVRFASYAGMQRSNFFSLIEIWRDNASYTALQNASDRRKTPRNPQPYLIASLDERDGNLVE